MRDYCSSAPAWAWVRRAYHIASRLAIDFSREALGAGLWVLGAKRLRKSSPHVFGQCALSLREVRPGRTTRQSRTYRRRPQVQCCEAEIAGVACGSLLRNKSIVSWKIKQGPLGHCEGVPMHRGDRGSLGTLEYIPGLLRHARDCHTSRWSVRNDRLGRFYLNIGCAAAGGSQ